MKMKRANTRRNILLYVVEELSVIVYM